MIRTKAPKPKVCKVCKTKFTPLRHLMAARVCSPICGMTFAKSQRGKAEKVRQVKERKEVKAKLKQLEPRKYWLAKAKVAIQASRRLEELAKGSGCISCGRSQKEVAGTDGWKPGGLWDGGHFMSKGARPELALEPLNVWLQCKSCNGGSGKYARKGYTVNNSFEANLRAREGDELVDWLKGPHELKHWTIEQLQAIEAEHSAKAKELKARQE